MHPVRFEPASGPCQPNASRIIVDNANEEAPLGAAIDVFASSPGSGLAFREHPSLHWNRAGVSSVIGVNPAHGEGPSGRFLVRAARESHSSGAAKVELLFNDRPDERGGCYLSDFNDRDGGERRMVLEGDGRTGPQISYLKHPQRIENSRCSAVGTGFLYGGDIAVQFKSSFYGPKNIYVRTTGSNGEATPWQQVGTWIAGNEEPPQAVSVSPYLGSGTRKTFTFSFMDPNGRTDIAKIEFLLQKLTGEAGACTFHLDRSSVTPAAGPTVAVNGPCKVSNVQVSFTSTDSLQVRADVDFAGSNAGRRNIYATVQDRKGQSSGLVWLGSWVVPGQ